MKQIIFLLSLFVLLNCKIEINSDVEINFYSDTRKYYISEQNGIIPLTGTPTQNIFDAEDLEEQTAFNITLNGDSENNYTLNCRLWKGDGTNVNAFCNFQESLKEDVNITQEIETTIVYNNTNINMTFHFKDMQLRKLNGNIPFLYSASKTINVQESDEKIYLEFKCDSYHNELLLMRTNEKEIIPRIVELENCTQNGNNLKCEVPKANLDVIANNNNQFVVLYVTDLLGETDFQFVSQIEINYPIVTKEEISFNLGDVVENPVYYNSFITFSTDAKNVPKLRSTSFNIDFSDFSIQCFFIKHDDNNPLYLSCYVPKEMEFTIETIDEYTMSNKHYKYNFKFLPGKKDDKLASISPKKTHIYKAYPDTLDFTNTESIDIYIAIENVDEIGNIRLNPDGEDLNCENKYNMKKCSIKKEHFAGKSSGYYYINHKDSEGNYTKNCEAFGFKVILPNDGIIVDFYPIKDKYYIGNDKGAFGLTGNYSEGITIDDPELESKTSFSITIKGTSNNEYELDCRLWNGITNYISAICNFKKSLIVDEEIINTETEAIITYNEKKLVLHFHFNQTQLQKINGNIPFLYSAKQEINIVEGQKTIDVEFKIDSYNDELLFIRSTIERIPRIIKLENCQKKEDGKKLGCQIIKENLDVIAIANNKFQVLYINDLIGQADLPFIDIININYPQIQKEDIYFKLEKNMQNPIDRKSYVTFSTNVTNVPKLHTGSIELTFKGQSTECFFIKHDDSNPLYITCYAIAQLNFTIGTIKGFQLNDINYKYNFILGPGRNDELITIYEPSSTYIYKAYPDTLDFTNTESIDIFIAFRDGEKINNIRLNPDGEDLVCYRVNDCQKCKVPKTHFNGTKGGYYYIYHKDNVGKYATNYEAFGFTVILPGEKITIEVLNYKTYNVGEKNGFFAVESTFKDENDFFNDNDIEEKTNFSFNISNKNQYTLNCRLWRGKYKTIVLICGLASDFLESEEFTIDKSIDIQYNSKKVILKMNFVNKLIKIDGKIPFLYSAPQTISIADQQIINMKFNMELYNYEQLFILGNGNRMLSLDKCTKGNKILICEISREKLDIIAKQNDQFELQFLNDVLGYEDFKMVYSIKINYQDITKEDVYLNLEEIMYDEVQMGSFFTFKTNITNLPKIRTDMFTLEYNSSIKSDCIFIKHEQSGPLYLTCDSKYYGDILLENITFEKTDIHYKYNFKLNQVLNQSILSIGDSSDYVYLYPETIDFSLKDSYIINIATGMPQRLVGIKFNENGEELECSDKPALKECKLPRSHFKESGYYLVHHKYGDNKYVAHYEAFGINVVIPEEKIIINVSPASNKKYYIGKENIIAFSGIPSENIFDDPNLENETPFEIEIKGETDNEYKLNCRLWKKEDNNIGIFCKFNESLKDNETTITQQVEGAIIYKGKKVSIKFNFDNIKLYQLESNIPFIYSNPQKINVADKINLEFKCDSYNNELLFIMTIENEIIPRIIQLENCNKQENKLKCEISKVNLDIIANANNKFKVLYVNDIMGRVEFDFVSQIEIDYPDTQKEDLTFNLVEIQENPIDLYSYVTFSTNITNIPKIHTKSFRVKLTSSLETECFFIKHDDSNPLYITCYAITTLNNFTIGNINRHELNNLHYKYNFILTPGENRVPISIIEPPRTYIYKAYPDTLDFTNTNSIDIYIAIANIDKMENFKLNPDGEVLTCQTIENMKLCKVTKDHFRDKNSGYYYIHHNNNENIYPKDCEVFGFKVILPGNGGGNGDDGNTGTFNKYSLALIALLGLLVL